MGLFALISSILVIIINILATHSLLTKKRSLAFCLIVFLINTAFIVFASIFVISHIHNLTLDKFFLYFIGFSNIVYIHLVFREALSKKIFTMFSVWLFSTIVFFVANAFEHLLVGIVDVRYLQYIEYVLRNFIQLLLLMATYLWMSSPYKRILSLVSNRTVRFMSLYPLLAFLLLINNVTTYFGGLRDYSSIYSMLFLFAFIICGYVLVFAGISSASKIQSLQFNMEKLQWESSRDPLTGLYNRRYISDQMENGILNRNNNKNYSVIIVDVDFFKKINDTYGHDCGDRLLNEISQCLKEATREKDLVSRWGGDEFLIILRDTELETANGIANYMKKMIDEKIIEYDGVRISVSITLGVAVNENDELFDTTLKKADMALYEGKNRRSQVSFM